MRRLVVGAAVAALLGGTGAAWADHAGTNPTDPDAIGGHPALYGLCTAWHANENGRENGKAGEAPPFASLAQAAENADQSVTEFCTGVRPGNGHGNGGGSNAPDPTSHPGGRR
ncbi:MAG TPA: hypothetical protein VM618_08900 [Acidimicrobiia bacterium]|nr:hypothetical protein [Acidimicrobiia bacterium]